MDLRIALDNHQNRRASAAQADPENSALSGQREQSWQHRTYFFSIRLVDPILHRHPQQVSSLLRKRQSEHRNGLNIRHDIRARIISRQHRPGFAGGKGVLRKHDNGAPVCGRFNADGVDRSTLICGRYKSAQPAGSGVIRVPFQSASLFQNLLGAPAKLPEVYGQSDCSEPACSR
jgi:hypothetical protein